MVKTTQQNLRTVRRGLCNSAFVLAACMFVMTVLLAGCSSGRISVEGYDDSALNHKRVFLLLPQKEDLDIVDPAAFAYSRGIGEIAAPERLMRELSSDLPPALDALLDSNTVLDYSSQTVGATIPLQVKTDFRSDAPTSWNWDKIREATKAGNIDYLVVVRKVEMLNKKPERDIARGPERITLTFVLIDPIQEKQMTMSEVDAQLTDPRRPVDTYKKIAEAMTKKLPFHIKRN